MKQSELKSPEDANSILIELFPNKTILMEHHANNGVVFRVVELGVFLNLKFFESGSKSLTFDCHETHINQVRKKLSDLDFKYFVQISIRRTKANLQNLIKQSKDKQKQIKEIISYEINARKEMNAILKRFKS